MEDCFHCKHSIIRQGEAWDCKKGFYPEQGEPCEEFDECTTEDAYWEKYEAQEKRAKWANNDFGYTWSELE